MLPLVGQLQGNLLVKYRTSHFKAKCELKGECNILLLSEMSLKGFERTGLSADKSLVFKTERQGKWPFHHKDKTLKLKIKFWF